MKRKSEILSGVGAIGISYHSSPYWARLDGRPSLHVSLWWIKLYILLPWQHVTPLGHGSATSDYGVFWWPSCRIKPNFMWSTLRVGQL